MITASAVPGSAAPGSVATARTLLFGHGGDITWDELLLVLITYLLLMMVAVSGLNRRTTPVASAIADQRRDEAAGTDCGGAAISVLDVSHRYRKAWVLGRIDLAIEPGQFVSIIGANGAGKTTLLSILSTLETPTAGDVVVGPASMRADPASVRAQVGVLGHKPLLYPRLTVIENLRLFATLFGLEGSKLTPTSHPTDHPTDGRYAAIATMSKTDVDERIRLVLSQVSLLDRMHEQVWQLSHGQKQRVAFARALLHEPRILLLDEPFAGLDLIAAERLDSLLDEQHELGRTIIMTSHDLRRSYERADRLVVLAAGRIAGDVSRHDTTLDDLETLYRDALRSQS